MANEELVHTILQPSRKLRDSLSSFGAHQTHEDLFGTLPSNTVTPDVNLEIFGVSDGYVVIEPGRDGLIFDSNGELIDKSNIWRAPDTEKYTLEYLIQNSVELPGPVFVGVDTAWTNYYHWIVLLLSKSLICAEHLPEDLKFILPDLRLRQPRGYSARFSNEVWLQTLLRFGLYHRSHIKDDGIYRFSKIYFAATEPSQPAFITYMNKFYDVSRKVRPDLGIMEKVQNKLIIQRADNKRISDKFGNICDKLVNNYNYKPIYLEYMDFYEQCTAFRTAKIVVAPHGAGLSNIIMGSSNLKVLELNSYLEGEQYLRPWFYLLTEGMGQKYKYINISTERMLESEILALIQEYENM